MTRNNTSITMAILLLIAAAVLTIGGLALVPATQMAEAVRNCDPNPPNPDDSFTCSGGEGGKTTEGDTVTSGGSGGHITCDADSICTSSGGTGAQIESATGDPLVSTAVGGFGGRTTGDFNTGDTDTVGGSGQHEQGCTRPNPCS